MIASGFSQLSEMLNFALSKLESPVSEILLHVSILSSLNHQSLHDKVLYTVVLKENPDIIEEKDIHELEMEEKDGSSI